MMKTVFGSESADDRFFNGTEAAFAFVHEFERKDFLYFADDADVKFVGRRGDDAMFLYGASGVKTVDAGAGADYVRALDQNGAAVRLGSGNDSYRGDGDLAAKVNCGSGNDTFFGDGAKSSYFGESGNDTFTANHYFVDYGAGNTFNGGLGKDRFSYLTIAEVNSSVYINLDKGVAWAHASPLKDRLVSIENATGSSSDDTLIGSGIGNTLSGGEGDDLIKGLAGNDILHGEGPNTDVLGLSSRDRLIGGAGSDTLIGGLDADVLQGGFGKDVFVYTSIEESRLKASDGISPGRDTIKDFHSAEHDRIDLSATDADTTATGNQNFSFIGRSAFTGEAGEVHFRFGMLSADVDGDRIPDFQVRIFGVASLSESDLIL